MGFVIDFKHSVECVNVCNFSLQKHVAFFKSLELINQNVEAQQLDILKLNVENKNVGKNSFLCI